MNIMVVEDDPQIREELALALKNSGYTVCFPLGFGAVDEEIRRLAPHLILLDVNLPGMDGFRICGKIRAFSQVPIIFVTSRSSDMDELTCMTLGGDDFVSKPYNMPVLLARISALLKRAYPQDARDARLSCGGITLDAAAGTASGNGVTVELTRNELKILYYLFSNQGKILSRTDIIEYLWDNELFVDDNTLSVNITRIRNKLEALGGMGLIKTKRGQGYLV